MGLGLGMSLSIAPPVQAVEVERVVSPGGVEAWLVRDKNIPITTLAFSFRNAGGGADPTGKAGLANLTASLLDEGAGDLNSQAFQGRLENLAIRLSFGAGLETFRGNLKTLNRNRDEAVDLLRLALTKPRFDDDAVQRIRSQIEIGLKQRETNPDSRASRIWRKALFGDHPSGRPVNGKLSTLAAITTDDMRQFVLSRLTRDRLIIGAVGDINAVDLGTLLDKAFGGLPAVAPKQPQVPAAKLSAAGDVFISDMDIPQSVVLFGQPGLQRSDPDYYAAYVMNYVLGGGGFASRLYTEVREKRGLVYSVYSYLNPMRKGPQISGGLATRNEQVGEALSLVRAEWKKMHETGISADELRRAKQFLNGAFPLRLSSTAAIARILVSMQYNALGIDYLDRRASLINTVTRADIDRVAKQLLNPDTLTIVVVGRPKNVKATAETPDIDY
ncbi:MAG: insulinase family protein [Alphaproteobacteria bacterium]|nr:insulinase family protein [Alphaproteobacteria bacterium]